MNEADRSERALIVSPFGSDVSVAGVLDGAGLTSETLPSLTCLLGAMKEGAGFAVLASEAIDGADFDDLARWVEAQPAWSDFPFVVVMREHQGGEPEAAAFAGLLGNVSVLERPFHPTTLVSLGRAALRGRRRQYEARAAQERTRESEARLRLALEAGRLGAWEYSFATRHLECSERCKANFGRAPWRPFTFDELQTAIHDDDRDRVFAAVRRSVDENVQYHEQYRVVWPDGSAHWIESRARVTRDAQGDAAMLVGVVGDITSRKEGEAHIAREMEERTKALDIASEQLRQSQKMEAIGQLTGGVAHDFNNLLMAVLGNLDLLRRRVPDDPRVLRLIDGALQGAQRGAALTQRLLAFARRQDLQPRSVDVGALVEGMSDLITRSIGPSIRFRLDANPDLPPALVDPNQLELALLNLAINARDAMPEGGRLTIDLAHINQLGREPDLAPGDYVSIAIVDTGQGMDHETRRRAIEPFFSTKGVGKGTGLGLSMAHGLAVQSGGALRIESKPGAGARIVLLTPVATTPSQTLDHSVAPTRRVEAAPATILLVDDDPLIATSATEILEDLGHHVIGASSGAQALSVLRGPASVDLLVTDFAMPGMDGIELARQARATRPTLPVLFTTGFADLPSGVTMDFPRLSKPYTQAQLADKIAKLLER